MSSADETVSLPSGRRRRYETIAFVLLALVLIPILSVIVVGGYGFLVWMQQLVFGPPGA